ncbi:MAG: phage baseplate assembly protein V [Magnetospirillum sp.]|nr:phage baseplate assembly protein V [Magnetospirillum sp.]
MTDPLAAIERLFHRVLHAFGAGTLTAVNDAGGTQLVQAQLSSAETIDDLPRLSEYGFASNPPAGSDAVMVFLGGERAAGIVIATGNQTLRLRSLQSGETAIYDALGRSVLLSQAGPVIDANGAPVTVNNATTVTVAASVAVILDTPVLKVTGDIVDNCDAATPRSMADMRTIFNEHPHPDAQGGDTGTPSITM